MGCNRICLYGIIISNLAILSALAMATICFRTKILGAGMVAIFSFLIGITSELLATLIVAGLQGVPISEVKFERNRLNLKNTLHPF